VVCDHDDGAWVRVPPADATWEDDDLNPDREGGWDAVPHLNTVLPSARELHANWINFSADGFDYIAGLPDIRPVTRQTSTHELGGQPSRHHLAPRLSGPQRWQFDGRVTAGTGEPRLRSDIRGLRTSQRCNPFRRKETTMPRYTALPGVHDTEPGITYVTTELSDPSRFHPGWSYLTGGMEDLRRPFLVLGHTDGDTVFILERLDRDGEWAPLMYRAPKSLDTSDELAVMRALTNTGESARAHCTEDLTNQQGDHLSAMWNLLFEFRDEISPGALDV
jgi:hypothetical protein